MTVRLYSYSDPGAPAHPNATRGSMAALLRACLVDGYSLGEDVTPGAGWEEVYPELNNYSAFRSLVGARQIYRFDDNMADADACYIVGCESLAAVDATPVGQWSEDYFGKQYNSSYAEWNVIADEKTCYVILQTYAGNVIHGFGEFDSLVPDDPYNSFTAGHGSASGLMNISDTDIVAMHYAGPLGDERRIEVHRSAVGNFAGNGTIVRTGGNYYPGGNLYQSSVSSANVGLGFYTVPALISCSTASENGNYLVRGKLRGAYYPLAVRPKSHREQYVDEITGRTMVCMHWRHYSSGYYGCYMFDITGPW